MTCDCSTCSPQHGINWSFVAALAAYLLAWGVIAFCVTPLASCMPPKKIISPVVPEPAASSTVHAVPDTNNLEEKFCNPDYEYLPDEVPYISGASRCVRLTPAIRRSPSAA